MAKNKTNQTAASVDEFVNKVKDETKRDDSFALIKIMKEVTGFEPVLWGPSIIGFGKHHYVYASGHEGDMPLVGFSPRSAALVLYAMAGETSLLKNLGKHKAGKGCLYIKRLSDVDISVLKKIIKSTAARVPKVY